MALLWNDTTITGTANDDYILGDAGTGPAHSLSAARRRRRLSFSATRREWTLLYSTAPGTFTVRSDRHSSIPWYQGPDDLR